MRIINLIKYPNRKLYAKTGEVSDKGTYVNLKEVADFVRQGYGFKVTRKTDKADITNEVLRDLLLDDNVSISNDMILGLVRGNA
jgi:polyhydroxyalkanoate synthesis regulator protein